MNLTTIFHDGVSVGSMKNLHSIEDIVSGEFFIYVFISQDVHDVEDYAASFERSIFVSAVVAKSISTALATS